MQFPNLPLKLSFRKFKLRELTLVSFFQKHFATQDFRRIGENEKMKVKCNSYQLYLNHQLVYLVATCQIEAATQFFYYLYFKGFSDIDQKIVYLDKVLLLQFKCYKIHFKFNFTHTKRFEILILQSNIFQFHSRCACLIFTPFKCQLNASCIFASFYINSHLFKNMASISN